MGRHAWFAALVGVVLGPLCAVSAFAGGAGPAAEVLDRAQGIPGSRRFVALQPGSVAVLWDENRLQPTNAFYVDGAALSVEAAPNGSRVGIIAQTSSHPVSGHLSVWETSAGTRNAVMGSGSNRFAFSQDGAVAAVAGFLHGVSLYDFRSYRPRYRKGENDGIERIASWQDEENGGRATDMVPLEDGRWVAGRSDGRIHIVTNTGGIEETIQAHEGVLPTIDAAAARGLFATGSEERVAVWDASRLKRRSELHLPGEHVHSASFSPSGTELAIGTASGLVTIWDLESDKRRASYRFDTGKSSEERRAVVHLDYSGSGERVIVALTDRSVHLLSAGDLAPVKVLDHRFVSALAYRPDGSMLAQGRSDGSVALFDRHNGQRLRGLAPEGGDRAHRAAVTALAFTPDGRRLLSGSLNGDVRAWNPDTGQIVSTYSADAVRDIEVAEGGRWLAFAGMRSAGAPAHLLRAHAVSSDWQFRAAGELSTLYTAVAFGADGRTLYTGDPLGVVRARRIPAYSAEDDPPQGGGELASVESLTASGHGIERMSFDAEGGRLIAGTGGGELVWIAPAPALSVERSADPFDTAVTALELDAEGDYVAAGSFDGELTVFDRQSRERLLRRSFETQVTAFAFHPLESRLTVATVGGGVTQIALPPAGDG